MHLITNAFFMRKRIGDEFCTELERLKPKERGASLAQWVWVRSVPERSPGQEMGWTSFLTEKNMDLGHWGWPFLVCVREQRCQQFICFCILFPH